MNYCVLVSVIGCDVSWLIVANDADWPPLGVICPIIIVFLRVQTGGAGERGGEQITLLLAIGVFRGGWGLDIQNRRFILLSLDTENKKPDTGIQQGEHGLAACSYTVYLSLSGVQKLKKR